METPDVFFTKEIAMTQDVIDDFITFCGDCNLVHTDDEWTARNTRFPRRIAHGSILNGFISRCITEHFGPGTIYVEQTLQFKHPIYIGDKITILFKDLVSIKKLTKFTTDVILSETAFHSEDGHTQGTVIATGHAVIVAKKGQN